MSSFAQLTSLHSTQKCMHTKQILHLCMPKWSYFNADSSNYTYKAKRNYQSSIDSIVFISIVKSKIIKLCQDCHVLHFPSPLACSLFVSTASLKDPQTFPKLLNPQSHCIIIRSWCVFLDQYMQNYTSANTLLIFLNVDLYYYCVTKVVFVCLFVLTFSHFYAKLLC